MFNKSAIDSIASMFVHASSSTKQDVAVCKTSNKSIGRIRISRLHVQANFPPVDWDKVASELFLAKAVVSRSMPNMDCSDSGFVAASLCLGHSSFSIPSRIQPR